MHIGILRTDSVRPEWVPTYGEYPDMFERLLLAEDDALTFTTWNVEAGELPDSVEAADSFLITGVRAAFTTTRTGSDAWKASCASATPPGAK
jgi:hypothetical protein